MVYKNSNFRDLYHTLPLFSFVSKRGRRFSIRHIHTNYESVYKNFATGITIRCLRDVVYFETFDDPITIDFCQKNTKLTQYQVTENNVQLRSLYD